MKHLAAYFPHQLKCVVTDRGEKKIDILAGLYNDGECVFHNIVEAHQGEGIKPILSPLSAYKDINSKTVQELNYDVETLLNLRDFAHGEISLSQLAYGTVEMCHQAKIDIYGLIDQGLAVDINTL